jgi:uncharacterized BrkB/YihY/UPF0761 family membrane protein
VSLRGAVRRGRGLYDRVLRAADRHPSLSAGFAVVRRDTAVGGTLVAGALAFRLFIWLLPCCLLLTAVLGLTAAPDELGRNLGMSPLTASMLGQVAAQTRSSRYVTVVVSVVLLCWVGLSLGRALDHVHDRVWGGRLDRHPRPTLARAARYSGALLLVVVGNLAGPVLVAATGGSPAVISLPSLVFYGVTGVVVLSGRWPPPWRSAWPGALLLALGIEVLHLAAVVLLPRALAHSLELYGALGIAASLLLWLAFLARLLVLGQVLNAVLAGRRAAGPPSPGDATPPAPTQPVPGERDDRAGGAGA